MPTIIFSKETSSSHEWLAVNDDGSLTHHTENCGWSAMRQGVNSRERCISTSAAKRRWPELAQQIEELVAACGAIGQTS